MTSQPEFEILPKLLPQVIKAIVDLHELNGSTIEDIIDQVKTNMAFYGIRSTKKNIKAQVHLSLRHGVRLGCFRVESQGKFRINKLKYCVPVLKCVLSPHCVNSAINSRYLLRHCSSDVKLQQQLPQQEQTQPPLQNQQLKLVPERNQQTKKQRLKKNYKCPSTRKTCSLRCPESTTTAPPTTRSCGCVTRSSTSSRSHQQSPPHVGEVISEMNTDLDKSILPFFRDPLTSYKKSSNTSMICIYDPAGHMGPQMECDDTIQITDEPINGKNQIENMAGTADQSSTAVDDMCRNSMIKSNAPTIQSSIVSTKVSLSTINSVASTRDQSLDDVRKLKQTEGVLKRLQRKFDQLQRSIWGGKSSRNAILTPENKDSR
ncbi:uncharacterized protein LOC123293115 [Chrysoperla carnea]|uniref:uncharacterized protein LOC123293115 n=1 Tax=Chrysoperla carnea TaxID=189513 RepID=UPI001D08CF3C|nr:uncharacterized protein LOC123293115 [Chrysoperla carnea]